jgi:hypothetical protein
MRDTDGELTRKPDAVADHFLVGFLADAHARHMEMLVSCQEGCLMPDLLRKLEGLVRSNLHVSTHGNVSALPRMVSDARSPQKT